MRGVSYRIHKNCAVLAITAGVISHTSNLSSPWFSSPIELLLAKESVTSQNVLLNKAYMNYSYIVEKPSLLRLFFQCSQINWKTLLHLNKDHQYRIYVHFSWMRTAQVKCLSYDRTIPFNLYLVWPTFIFLYNFITFISSGENSIKTNFECAAEVKIGLTRSGFTIEGSLTFQGKFE